MEEKKNNAVEKVENVMEQNNTGNNTSNSSSNQYKGTNNEKRLERERIRAEKKMELARIKARNQAEREKAKATALRDKNRRKAQALAKREQLRQERENYREMLKHESQQERQERIAQEKMARQEEKYHKQELKKQKFLAKQQERENRAKNKQKNREQGRGYGGWLAAVISLGIATLVLSSALTFMFLMPQETDMALESAYSRSFYETVTQVDNMEVNLSKVLASKDNGARQNYLVDLAINSELAEENLQVLPLKDENKFYTTKIINQIGDYAKFLNKKLIDGQSLTAEDIQNITQLYKANLSVKESLHAMLDKMGNDFSFTSISDNDNGNVVIENFKQLQNLSVEYPELIYDGPFSDGQQNLTVKGLGKNEITCAEAEAKFKKVFAERNLKKVKVENLSNGRFECFNIVATTPDGDIYAEISKMGGELIMFDYAGSCKEVNFQSESAVKSAENFLNEIGLNGMKAVWINLSNNVYTINFAYESGGVIVYPDMAKVRVCAETCKVIGFEGTGYYSNHQERQISKPTISKQTATKKVSEDMLIESVRLALIPIGIQTEKLCYEISGEINGATYYTYIDAQTGRQVQMFKVIETSQGSLLI